MRCHWLQQFLFFINGDVDGDVARSPSVHLPEIQCDLFGFCDGFIVFHYFFKTFSDCLIFFGAMIWGFSLDPI